MRVYLVQHGEAKSEEEDPDRPLTDRGATEVRRVVGVAAGAGSVMVERIVHSGKTWARQTAAAWGAALGVPIDESAGLAPRDDPAIWAARVTAETRDMMLVGHLPHLARLARSCSHAILIARSLPSGRVDWSAWRRARRGGRFGSSLPPAAV